MRGTFCLKISKYKCWMNRHSRDERADKECGIKIWKIILFGAIALGTGFYSLDSQAQEAKDSEYTIIVSDEISDSVEELENAIKNAFGGVKANEINYRSPEAKRIIKKLKVEFIPYVIFEKNISEKEQFLNLLKKRMIVQKQNEYVIPEDMLFPMGGIFLKRKRMPDRVDLSKIIDHLKSLEIVSSTQIIFLDESLQRSICKLRCSLLPSRYKLDVRLIQTKTEIIYSCLYFRSRSQRCLTDWMITLPQP